jgi:hypothetical protein
MIMRPRMDPWIVSEEHFISYLFFQLIKFSNIIELINVLL